MIMNSVRVPLTDASSVGAARREAVRVAMAAGASAQKISSLGIVVTEMATNVVTHAREGEMLVHTSSVNGCSRLSVVTVDTGPGMYDVESCMRDGYSTSGTPGNGLGAVRRLANVFDVYSQAGRGAAVFAGFDLGERDGPVDDSSPVGIICVPIASEEVSGDSCCVTRDGDRLAGALVDGLGHGPFAAEAARCAIDVFAADAFAPPQNTLRKAHERMSSTRGGALAVALVDASIQTLCYAAVGNISASLVGDGRSRSLMTQNGIVGGAFRGLKEIRYALEGARLLIMHSDGLKTRWQLSDHPGLSERHPMVIAAILYRDYSRKTDDVSVMVVQLRS